MRRRTGTLILCTLMLALSLLFVACEMPTISGIEITAQPKLNYQVGDTFDPTGMEVSRVLSNGERMIITDYTIDAPEALSRENNVVTITYGTHKITINLKVTPVGVGDIEIKLDDSLSEGGNMSLEAILYRISYTDGTVDEEWRNVTKEDVVSQEVKDGVLHIALKVFARNAFVEKEVTVDLNEKAVTVSQLLEKTEGYTYLLKGRFVGVGTTNAPEMLVAEEETGAVIGVSGLITATDFANLAVDMKGFEVGDEVIVPVYLKNAAVAAGNSNSGKLFAQYDSESIAPAMTLSHSDDYTISKENAVTISSQEELRSFLSAENRPENAYKMVKLTGEINLITYTANFVRFFFNGVTDYAGQKIDGVNCSPVFHNPAQRLTCGTNFGGMAFGDENFSSTSWANPYKMKRDVYAIFIGGTTWYHYFTILSADDIDRGAITDVEFTAPAIDLYTLGGEFDITGGKVKVTYALGEVEEYDLTMDMIDEATIPNTNVAGEYTVKANCFEREFSFKVSVVDKAITSLALEAPLAQEAYDYVNGKADLVKELVGKNLVVNYNVGAPETVAITEDMIAIDSWSTTEGAFTLSCMGESLTLTVKIKVTSLSVSEFLQKATGETHLVRMQIVDAVSSQGAIELIVKDVEKNVFMGIYNSGIAGSTKEIQLDTSVVNKGDIVIAPLTVKSLTSAGNEGKKYGNASATTFTTDLIVESTGNTMDISPKDIDVYAEIDSQEDLVAFLSDANRFYKVVKISGDIKAVLYSAFLRIYFDDSISSLAAQKVNGPSPVFNNNGFTYRAKDFSNYFTNSTSTKYSDPARSDYTFYMIFVGGNSYYHIFAPLQEDWIVEKVDRGEIVSVDFTAPTTTVYTLNDQLSLDGGKVKVTYANGDAEEHKLTTAMLDQTTVPDMTAAGEYTVKANCFEREFTFTVSVVNKAVTSIALEAPLAKEEYGYTDGKAAILEELIGKNLVVNYNVGAPEKLAITEEMITFESWTSTQGSVVISYKETIATYEVKVKTAGISVSEFLQKAVGETHMVRMQIVDAVSSQGAIELIVKDVEKSVFMGIYNSGIAGSTKEIQLDTSVVNKGDIVIAPLTLKSSATSGHEGKKYGNASAATFTTDLIVESTSNTMNISPKDIDVYAEIDSQEDLVAFLSDANRFYKVVKISGDIKAVVYSAFLRIYFDDSISTLAAQKVNGPSPVFNNNGFTYRAKDLSNYFTNSTATKYSDPARSDYTFYMIFVGGNSYYHVFAPLQEDWIVAQQA